jgi:MFS family permease
VFAIHEASSPEPLIALAVIRRRESVASVSAALQAATISAAVYLGSLYLSQVPLATLATSNTNEEARGAVAGVYNMAQQVGTAIGLAAFSVVAVAYADGSTVADRLHGLQVAILATSALALAAAVLAGLTLPHGTVTDPSDSLAEKSERAPGQDVLPMQAESETEN